MKLEVQEVEKKEPRYTKSHDFRHVPTDTINMGVGDNGIKLIFSVEEAPGEVSELVGVHMSHRTAAKLRNALISALKKYEETSGQTIDPQLELSGER